MAADARLRASALLALTKLMAVDAGFCDANLRLVFTLLQSKCGARSVASTLLSAAR
jgi:condensin complex subunit 1